jgi:hypothetical protein
MLLEDGEPPLEAEFVGTQTIPRRVGGGIRRGVCPGPQAARGDRPPRDVR